jgi:hypothetical protein
VITSIAPAPDQAGHDCVQIAAVHVYDAECALHAAHQSGVDAWINAANEKLHEAVAEYLTAASTDPASPRPLRTRRRQLTS